MIFAAIADVHGNHLALEAVLEDIRGLGISDIVNLGDCFSGPLDAARTAELLMPLDAVTVCGNHDRALIDRPFEAMGDWERPSFEQLSEEQLDWIRTLPFSTVFRDEVYLCHATPQDDNTYWMETLNEQGIFHLKPLSEIEARAEGIDQPLILCGHSHIARSVQLSDGRLIVNPGSVGCPGFDYDKPFYHKAQAGTPFAAYAVLEKTGRGWQPSFRQVRYDNLAAADMAKAYGMTDWISALSTGWIV
ncbi:MULTISPECIES: metallophosphoesterase family protein [Alphaproteobacteria]|uniref:DNA methylase n=2 Tax=Alphaproteobacteria TaxID=28211 RepID=A0A512HF41_9HYPH|nr:MULTISPECIES: metallophosphoesterase family protein [Alphaproteobacteria]GEO84047.1 DNA methylase [Ciceribacter naphthalenivorans]GLR21075.1 DNA methylase [Ciceribacter naphthalenivorans]GLT03931.1 DNA methylase [Sphingomonas psychrolutea]